MSSSSESAPSPSLVWRRLNTQMGSTFAFHETPAMPVSLFAAAAAMPATCVPCCISESVWLSVMCVRVTAFHAYSVLMFALRSECSKLMPVSSTATVTLLSVCARAQAS